MKKADKQMKTQLGAQYITRARMVRKVYLPTYEPRKHTSAIATYDALLAYMGEENKAEAHRVYTAMYGRKDA